MILLKSNAHSIYWLARYLTRIQQLCGHLPFEQDQHAHAFAQGFGLDIDGAASLNALIQNSVQSLSLTQQLQQVQANLQDLRGVLSAKVYAELNQLVRAASQQPVTLCRVISHCISLLEAESPEVWTFFALGQQLELLDWQIRLQQPTAQHIHKLAQWLDALDVMGWHTINAAWHDFKKQPELIQLYALTQQLQIEFEAAA